MKPCAVFVLCLLLVGGCAGRKHHMGEPSKLKIHVQNSWGGAPTLIVGHQQARFGLYLTGYVPQRANSILVETQWKEAIGGTTLVWMDQAGTIPKRTYMFSWRPNALDYESFRRKLWFEPSYSAAYQDPFEPARNWDGWMRLVFTVAHADYDPQAGEVRVYKVYAKKAWPIRLDCMECRTYSKGKQHDRDTATR